MAYATVAALRAFLDFPDSNHSQDDELATVLDVATLAVDDYCGRTFGAVSTSAARIFPGGTSRTPIDDAATVTIVEHSADRQTWTTVGTTDWWTEPAQGTPKTVVSAMFPLSRFVRVTGTWGYGSTPDQVERATLMWAARLWKRKASVTGVEGFGDFGVVRIARTDSDVAMLLDPFKRLDKTLGLA